MLLHPEYPFAKKKTDSGTYKGKSAQWFVREERLFWVKYLGYTKSMQALQLSDQLGSILMPNVIKNQAEFKLVLSASYDWTIPSQLQKQQVFCMVKVSLFCICTFNLL